MAETVVVGCKLPCGLQLEVDGKVIVVNGANSTDIVGGHGITRDVDKAHFERWMEQNKDSAAVKKELIFAHTKENSVQAQSKEQIDNKSGFEGIDPQKPGPGLEPAQYEGMK